MRFSVAPVLGRAASRALVSGTLAAAAVTLVASLACVYAALALGLSARDLIATRRSSATKPGPGKHTARTMRRYPRDPIKQAASDRSRGLENTDCRVLDQSSQDHCPRPTSGK